MDILNKIKSLLPINKNSPYFYTVDMGSDSIKVLLSEIDKEDYSLKILDDVKIAQEEDSFRSGKIINEQNIINSIKEAVSHLSTQNKIKTSDCVFTISGPNSRTIMSTLKVSRGEKAAISSEEYHEIMNNMLEISYKSLSQVLFEESLISDPGLEMLDMQPVYLLCDGRPVLDIEGEEANEVEICYSVSFAFSDYIHKINEISKKSGLNLVSVVPSTVSILNALKKSKKEKLDGVILNIGATTTEATVCFGGGIFLNKTLPIGGSDITKYLAKKLNVPYLQAEKVKRLYSLGKLKEKDAEIVSKLTIRILNYWIAGIEELFKNFSGVKAFAPEFYLLGGGSELPDIKEQVFEEAWSKSIPFKSQPEFKSIDITKIKELKLNKELKNAEDLLPILTAYYYFITKGMKNE